MPKYSNDSEYHIITCPKCQGKKPLCTLCEGEKRVAQIIFYEPIKKFLKDVGVDTQNDEED